MAEKTDAAGGALEAALEPYLRAVLDSLKPRQAKAVGGIALGQVGDDPFQSLPRHFRPADFERIENLMGAAKNPVFPDSDPGDFRSKNGRLVRRTTIQVMVPPGDAQTEPTRLLIQLRREWIPLGNFLGPLDDVTNLFPGIDTTETTRQVQESESLDIQETLDEVRESVENAKRTLEEASQMDLVETLSENTSVTASTSNGARVGVDLSLGAVIDTASSLLGLGGEAGVGVGGEITSSTSTDSTLASTMTSTQNASHLANETLQKATTMVNSKVTTAARRLQRATTELSRLTRGLSPILSRVTNLMSWNVYTRYAVLTFVEDVHIVRKVPLCELMPRPRPLVVKTREPPELTWLMLDPAGKAIAEEMKNAPRDLKKGALEALIKKAVEHAKDRGFHAEPEVWRFVFRWLQGGEQLTIVNPPAVPCPEPCFTAEDIVEYAAIFDRHPLRTDLHADFGRLKGKVKAGAALGSWQGRLWPLTQTPIVKGGSS